MRDLKLSDVEAITTKYSTETGTLDLEDEDTGSNYQFRNYYGDTFNSHLTVTGKDSEWVNFWGLPKWSGAFTGRAKLPTNTETYESELEDGDSSIKFGGLEINGRWNVYGNENNADVVLVYDGDDNWRDHVKFNA